MPVWEYRLRGVGFILFGSDDLATFLATAQQVGALILYLDADRGVVGFPHGGVIHVFDLDGLDEDGTENEDSDDAYYRQVQEEIAGGPLREIIDAVVSDDQYTPRRGKLIVAKYAQELSDDDFELVEDVAMWEWQESIGKPIERQALSLIPSIVSRADFDPMELASYPMDSASSRSEVVDGWLGDYEPRLAEAIRHNLRRYANDNGLIEAAIRDANREAAEILDDLPIVVRDRLGFSSRIAARLFVIEPFLDSVPIRRRQWYCQLIYGMEAERFGADREARFATAARQLLQLMNITQATRTLGISKSTMNRIVGAYPNDVVLTANDPIVTDLARGVVLPTG